MAHIFFEDYLESVEHLPSEFRELYAQIREKDLHYQEQRQRTAKKQSSFSKATRRLMELDGHEGTPAKIRTEYNRTLELLQEKIDLEGQATELLDKHIKRLEHDLKQFEQEMEEEKQKLDRAGSEIMASDKRSMKRRAMDAAAAEAAAVAAAAAAAAAASSSHRSTPSRKRKHDPDAEAGTPADGAIDPNEPLYCFCQQVSFGEMVACDSNEQCPYQWFHYQCVGLTTPPKGKWYCTECTVKRRKLLASLQ